MKVLINGEETSIVAASTVAQYLELAGWKPTQVVVEHNGRVLPRQRLPKVRLSEGDRLEIVIPVAGG